MLAYGRAPLADWIAARPPGFATALGWSGLALCIALPEPQEAEGVSEALRLIGVYCGLAAAFVSTFAPGSGFRDFCAKPWISLIGGACYSIYLVHLQVTQVVASLAAKAAPGAPLVMVAAVFALSALAVLVVGLTYYVAIERRFMTRNWHLLVWAEIRNALGRGERVDNATRLVASRDDAPSPNATPRASRRAVGE